MTDVLIPIKSLALAKSRLADTLDRTARAELVEVMLIDLLTTLRQCTAGYIWIVSAEEKIFSIAARYNIRAIREEVSISYNHAVNLGLKSISSEQSVLVLPGDLPAASRQDLSRLLKEPPVGCNDIRLVPDKDWEGTNGLFMSSPDLIPPLFGPHSFDDHKRAARRAGIEASIMDLPSLAADIDISADLLAYSRGDFPGATAQYLRAINYQNMTSERQYGSAI
jgi:2-phospho-L-lactate guanylyltransferase